MATFTLTRPDRYPTGTSVSAYPASNWPSNVTSPSGAPLGSAVSGSAATATAAGVTFPDVLASGTSYFAYALVSGEHRYVGFRTATRSEGGGIELGYAEITSNFTTTSTGTQVDVAGLSVAVVTADRPITIEFYCSQIFHSAAGAAPSLRLLEGSTIIETAGFLLPTAGGGTPGVMRVRRNPAPGAYTYKVAAFQPGSPGGTITMVAAAIAPAHLSVIER